jgi:hypothetical protein
VTLNLNLNDTMPPREAVGEQPRTKKPYVKPRLTVFGSLDECLASFGAGAQLAREVLAPSVVRADSWYRLDAAEGVGELVEDVWKLAREVSRFAGEPDYSNAIFLKNRPGTALTLYFSPAARLLAEALGAVPCNRPSPSRMTLVAGDTRAWQIHFGRVFARRATRGFQDTIPSEIADLTKASPLQ